MMSIEERKNARHLFVRIMSDMRGRCEPDFAIDLISSLLKFPKILIGLQCIDLIVDDNWKNYIHIVDPRYKNSK